MGGKESTPVSKVGSSDISDILNKISLLPMALCTSLTGKAVRPFLAEVTGISQSHLRRGKNSILRKSTEDQALISVNKWIMERAEKQGWSESEINANLQSSPSKVDDEPRPYADFIYGLQIPGKYELPLTITFAVEVDKLVGKLSEAHRTDNLEIFKQAILECNWADKVFGYITNQHEAEKYVAELHAASDWSAALNALQIVCINIVYCLFAALDAEYGLIYFKRLQPLPLFLLVAPKMNPQFDIHTPIKRRGRNFVYMPIRRLLELSYALMIWGRDKRWPDKAVGRKELGEALGLDDQYIGNFFDGTRKLNAELFDSFWGKMCQTVAKCDAFAAPLPLFLAAIYWQTWIVTDQNKKIKSFILPDGEVYKRLWAWHHKRWASQRNTGAVDWPAWLVS